MRKLLIPTVVALSLAGMNVAAAQTFVGEASLDRSDRTMIAPSGVYAWSEQGGCEDDRNAFNKHSCY
jgi:hypothetical protein